MTALPHLYETLVTVGVAEAMETLKLKSHEQPEGHFNEWSRYSFVRLPKQPGSSMELEEAKAWCALMLNAIADAEEARDAFEKARSFDGPAVAGVSP